MYEGNRRTDWEDVDDFTPFEGYKSSVLAGGIPGHTSNPDGSVSFVATSEELPDCFSQAWEFGASIHYVFQPDNTYKVTFS